MSCTCRGKSPFLWSSCNCPSIFLASLGRAAKTGKTPSQLASEAVDTLLSTYGRGNSLAWMNKPGPVEEPKKLAVHKRKRKG